MRLTVVGTRAIVSVPDEASPGYLIASGGRVLLVECGPGVTAALRQYVRFGDLAGIIISHMHFDNFYDLLTLALSWFIEEKDMLMGMPAASIAPIPLYLPPGGSEQLAAIIRAVAGGRETSMSYFSSPLAPCDFTPNTPFAVGPFTVHPIGPVAHEPGPCFGFRIADACATIGYSGDSAPCDALDAIARDTDLFLCDAYGITERIRSPQTARRLSADNAGKIAQRTNVRHLALTHLLHTADGWCDALRWSARTTYKGPISIARVGSVFEAPYV